MGYPWSRSHPIPSSDLSQRGGQIGAGETVRALVEAQCASSGDVVVSSRVQGQGGMGLGAIGLEDMSMQDMSMQECLWRDFGEVRGMCEVGGGEVRRSIVDLTDCYADQTWKRVDPIPDGGERIHFQGRGSAGHGEEDGECELGENQLGRRGMSGGSLRLVAQAWGYGECWTSSSRNAKLDDCEVAALDGCQAGPFGDVVGGGVRLLARPVEALRVHRVAPAGPKALRRQNHGQGDGVCEDEGHMRRSAALFPYVLVAVAAFPHAPR